MAVSVTFILTPQGRLRLVEANDAPVLDADVARRCWDAFARGSGHGLLQLGAGEVGTALSPVLCYWRDFGTRYVTALCTQADIRVSHQDACVPPPQGELERLALAAPMMSGAEYLTATVLHGLWREIDTALGLELAEARCDIQEFLKRHNPAWNRVGRVHFNLAENRRDATAPFAFLATYTPRLSAPGKAQHLPLGQALREYAGAANKERLLSLLLPVQRAAKNCAWLKAMVDAGEIFHPLRWKPDEALQLLKDLPQLESAGVVVRMPATWSGSRPPRPQATARIGGKKPSGLGADALLDFHMEVTLDGAALNPEEIRALLTQADGLVLVRGRWVEINRDKLGRMIEHFSQIERVAVENGLGFGEAMRMLAGADASANGADATVDADWSQVVAGPWLAETLRGLRSPEGLARVSPGAALNGTLREYQQVGVRWLYLIAKLGLGACLADDMGLGKTIQMLSLLLVLKSQTDGKCRPSLLVAPASLLANWASELERFAPSLKALIAHPSTMAAGDLNTIAPDRLQELDLVITSYGSLLRLPWVADTSWRLAILDEAQAIKNPDAKQTRAAKRLKTQARFALTGTPIENRSGDLWSIFDFINPGLLGSPKEFTKYTRRLADHPNNPYGPLRELTRPYILRRLKTDKAVIADLPDKTEVKAFCQLSAKQAALYQQAVEELKKRLDETEGIQRKGLILSFLMRFKQICNHPSQWLGDGAWNEKERQMGALAGYHRGHRGQARQSAGFFTQFRELTDPLSAFLGSVFGRPGLVLHGATAVKKRKDLVRRFQEDEAVGFFVLSLKAGGAGLNLTAASHVVHFDRWWNPAVENQATDRAFRIGQNKNVLVHKFVCRGTIEDKIDAMIESKQQLSRNLLEAGADLLLTELKDEELLKLVALDLNRAMEA